MTPASDWVMGKVGGALDLDNNNDYVLAANSASLNIAGTLTIAAWVKQNDVDFYNNLLTKGSAPSDMMQWDLAMAQDEIRFGFCTGAGGTTCIDVSTDHGVETTNGNLDDGIWYHVAARQHNSPLCQRRS